MTRQPVATVLVVVIGEIWRSRRSETARLADDIGGGVLGGSFLFVIGLRLGRRLRLHLDSASFP